MQESENEKQQHTLYELIGGNDKLRELVDRFYDLMDLEADFAVLRAMHPQSLEGSRDKLYLFLSGWSGGPDLYTPVHGHPFLRARHLPLAIGTAERDQWLTCMLLAMRELGYPEEKQDLLLNAFFWYGGLDEEPAALMWSPAALLELDFGRSDIADVGNVLVTPSID